MGGRSDGGHAAIVGRRAELDAIDQLLGYEGPAAAVLLDGEAGIGKTTIWRAGVRRARERGLQTLVAQPSAAETEASICGAGDLLAGVPDEAIDGLPSPQRAAVGAAVAQSESSEPFDQHALGRAAATPLRRAARRRHRRRAMARYPTAAALGFALRRLDRAALRVLFSRGRNRVVAPIGAAARARELGAARAAIEVGPLTPTEIGAMLRAELGVDLPRPRVELIARASGGNSMFALELARQPAPGAGTPSCLGETLVGRIRALDPPGKRP